MNHFTLQSRRRTIIIFLLIFIDNCLPEQLPSDIQKCNFGDGICIANSATDIIRRSSKGRMDLGIPEYEPYHVEMVGFNENGENTPVNLQLLLSDLNIEGISQGIVNRVVGFDRDPNTSKFEIYGVFPKLHVQGLYETHGRILVIPVNGKGRFTMNLTNVKVSIKIKPKVVVKEDGKTYLQNDKMKFLLEPEGATIHLNRFIADGNPLGDSINDLLNNNWKDFWEEVSPSVTAGMQRVVRNFLGDALTRFAYDDLFLPE